MRHEPNRGKWLSAVLVLVIVSAFLPVLGNGWVNWDDGENFLENLGFRGLAPENLKWAWETVLVGVYQPLGWMILQVEYSCWGLDPRGYHLTSVVFHIATALALWRLTMTLLDRIGRRDRELSGASGVIPMAAAMATALFAVHPLRVEVVAWASCQTYLPGLFFAILTVQTYLHAVDLSSRKGRILGLTAGRLRHIG
jgi:hypothetical protein